MKKLYIIKIGGGVIDDEEALTKFLKSFAAIEENKILVHGGGKLATTMANRLGLTQKIIEGRRITDIETLKIATMVYSGSINKNIVAKLQGLQCNALGLSGTDANAVLAHKRNHPTINFGYVGDIDIVNIELIIFLLNRNISLVFAPIIHDGNGQLLNTNADTLAQELARSLNNEYDTTLIYTFEKNGVLHDADDDNTLIPFLNMNNYIKLKAEAKISDGMIPKLDNAFHALENGVQKIIIGKSENLKQLIEGKSGTTIVND